MRNKPTGAPISDAIRLSVEARQTTVQSALAAIDSVHGDGKLPFCDVVIDRPAGVRDRGGIRKGRETGLPEIGISQYSPPIEMAGVATHEIGHLVDRFGLSDGSSWASISGIALAPWRNAVENSAPIRRLNAMCNEETASYRSGGTEEIEQKLVQYFLYKHEIFARSYVQYVAVRGLSSDLRKWLDFERTALTHEIYPTQWTDEAFLPVGEAFDDLFSSKGWIR